MWACNFLFDMTISNDVEFVKNKDKLYLDEFIGDVFICLFNLMDLDRYSKNIWHFFGVHYTNMWFTYMLFYMVFAEIFLVLVILSVISSCLINLVYSPLVRLVDRKVKLLNILYSN